MQTQTQTQMQMQMQMQTQTQTQTQMQTQTQTQTQVQTQTQTQMQTQVQAGSLILGLFSYPQREGNHLQYSQDQGRIQRRVLRCNSLMDNMTLAVASHSGVSLELAP